MKIYFDKHWYWTLKDAKLNEFVNASYGAMIKCPKLFNINGIQFEIVSYPNGKKTYKFFVVVGLKIKHLPANIEYITFFREIKCTNTNAVIRKFCKATASYQSFSGVLCHSKEIKNLQTVSFSALLDIKYVKYKSCCSKKYWNATPNIISDKCKFIWNTDEITLLKCRTMVQKQSIVSDSFDKNNWCLRLYPNGLVYPGETALYLKCLYLPHTIKAMDVKFQFWLGKVSPLMVPQVYKFCVDSKLSYGAQFSNNYMDMGAGESVSITVMLEIIKIYGLDGNIIDQKEWKTHGIVFSGVTSFWQHKYQVKHNAYINDFLDSHVP